ncbi:MAG: glutathione S-transferase family protein [Hyphomicrobiaceae bacterium]
MFGKKKQNIEIYADPISVNCKKVLAGLQLMEIDYTLCKVDYFAGEQKSPEYTALNPNMSLPTMKEGDFVLWESNIILQYVADAHKKNAFYPKDLRTRADLNRWMSWETGQWFPSCYTYLVENCVKPVLGASPDQSILDGEAERFHLLAGTLDSRLQHSDWLGGTSPTIADIAIAAPMHLHTEQKLPLEKYPHLTAWMTERIEKLPCWQNTLVGPGFKLVNAA